MSHTKTPIKTEKPIKEATADELSRFLTYFLQIPKCPKQLGREKLIAKISEAWLRPFIYIMDDVDTGEVAPEETEPAVVKTKIQDPKWGGKWVTVNIQEDRGNMHEDPVPLAHEGVQIRVPRGKDVTIREEYLNIMRNATHRFPIVNEDGTTERWRDVPRYVVQVIDPDAPRPEPVPA